MSRRPISKALRFSILERDGFACVYCGEAPPTKLHVDHLFPVSKGGTNEPENLRTACEAFNLGKAAGLPLKQINCQRGMAFATMILQRGGEIIAEAPDWRTFNIIVDFCISSCNPHELLPLVLACRSWPEAIEAIYRHEGYDPNNLHPDEEPY